jgi:Na+-transporting methylmalonyl-CoA/oxaloacetate decarboxylase gamma subunit
VTGALPIAAGDGYVAAAYLIFLFLVLSYLAIMAVKLGRIEREVVEIADAVDRRADAAEAVSQRTKEPVA